MPYQPIRLGEHVTGEAGAVVRQVIDPYLSEFRFLLTVQHSEQGPKDRCSACWWRRCWRQRMGRRRCFTPGP